MAKQLEVLDLDFEEIKQNLIEFMTNHPDGTFADYDFEGSAMNTLMDALAYTVHYTGMYANLALNESFLDTAILRKSVVSKAKEIGYIPTQSTGALSEFNLAFNHTPINNLSGVVVFPRGTKFLAATADQKSLPFVMYDDNYFYEGDPLAYTGIAHVVQGQFVKQQWTAADGLRYTIEQDGVSTDHMIVKINGIKWNPSVDFVEITPSSEVYFISEVEEGKIELYFGNDTLGKALADGDVIDVEFLINKGVEGNFLSQFSLIGDVFLGDTEIVLRNAITISDVVKSYDGTDPEDIASIKHLAPLDYQRQNRVVALEDYKTAVLSNYNNVQAINAWGGEDNIPPEYGTVFISIKPKTGENVSATTKTDIERNILSKFGVVGILPEIVDPDYIAINLTTTVYYNKDQTTLNTNQLVSAVNTTITDFFEDTVFDYEASFKYSNLMTDVDASEDSIVSNETFVEMSKYFIPNTGGAGTFYINFINAVEPGTVESIYWTNAANSQSQLKDDGEGNIDLYVNDVKFKLKVGIIDYANGNITLLGFNAEPLVQENRIYINCVPVGLNVKVSLNNVIVLGTVAITMEPITK